MPPDDLAKILRELRVFAIEIERQKTTVSKAIQAAEKLSESLGGQARDAPKARAARSN